MKSPERQAPTTLAHLQTELAKGFCRHLANPLLVDRAFTRKFMRKLGQVSVRTLDDLRTAGGLLDLLAQAGLLNHRASKALQMSALQFVRCFPQLPEMGLSCGTQLASLMETVRAEGTCAQVAMVCTASQ